MSDPSLTPPDDTILLAHGGGGELMRQFITNQVLSRFTNDLLAPLGDSAELVVGDRRLAFTSDSFVVQPLEFPGGDIGRLAVAGTVNDLSTAGAVPMALSLSLIIEEGLHTDVIGRVLDSVARTADEANVPIATGDTKVVEHGAADRLFINTAGVGLIRDGAPTGPATLRVGDAVLVSGTIGDHGITIMSRREGIAFDAPIESDVAPLNGLVDRLLTAASGQVRALKDPTRGGVAAVLNELAHATGVTIELNESALPIKPPVLGACHMLGLDPLIVANEGKMVVVCDPAVSDAALAAMRAHPLGRDAAVIGEVVASDRALVTLRTRVGGTSIVQMPYGQQLPRIC